ncbi:MAG: sensor histidine kinase [Opitutales bacterium]
MFSYPAHDSAMPVANIEDFLSKLTRVLLYCMSAFGGGMILFINLKYGGMGLPLILESFVYLTFGVVVYFGFGAPKVSFRIKAGFALTLISLLCIMSGTRWGLMGTSTLLMSWVIMMVCLIFGARTAAIIACAFIAILVLTAVGFFSGKLTYTSDPHIVMDSAENWIKNGLGFTFLGTFMIFSAFALLRSFNHSLASLREQQCALRSRNAALEKARADAEKASVNKMEFLGVMSHELRTPLNPILGFLDMLAEEKDPEERASYIETMQRSGQYLESLTKNISTYSKLEEGNAEINTETFDPAAVVADVIELLQIEIKDKSIELKSETHNTSLIRGDSQRIKQCLIILVSNAIKFTEQGEVNIRVAVAKEDRSENAQLEICVKDSGIGIDPVNHERIFDPFLQVDYSDRRVHEGMGLGLAICKKTADLLGGTISVESEINEGSVFCIKIPSTLAHKPEKMEAAR